MCHIKAENEMWSVNFTDEGFINVENKADTNKSFYIHLFQYRYQYLYTEWWAFPQAFFTPDLKYVIVTYGIGYVYFISLSEKRVVKFFKLFSDISYEDDSFEEIETCCHFDERTQVDFSNTGRYAAIRVRAIFDPQAAGAEKVIFTPVYFSSVFIVDLYNLELCFYEYYNDVQEEYKNLASIAFSPNDNYIAMGALGTIVKVFCIANKKCLGKFSSLVWISDSTAIKDCHLIAFLDENNFVYVNKDNDIIKVSLQQNGQFVQSGIIKTNYDKPLYIQKIELNKNEIICYVAGSMNYQEQKTFQLCFDAI